MEAMAQEWTDGRLDELSGKVDRGFEGVVADARGFRLEMKTEFASVRDEMKAEFASVRDEMKTEFASVRDEMKTEFVAIRAEINGLRGDMKAMDNKVTERLDFIQRAMIQMMVALTAAILAGFAGICTLIAAKL
jgi:hypothetical protein